jgi:hypothetical protein
MVVLSPTEGRNLDFYTRTRPLTEPVLSAGEEFEVTGADISMPCPARGCFDFDIQLLYQYVHEAALLLQQSLWTVIVSVWNLSRSVTQ